MVKRFASLGSISVVLSLLTAAVVLAGCGSFIASVDLQGSRHRLSEAITVTSEEQLLLALVQTRFIRNPGFLDVSAINTQLNWSAGINGSYSTSPSTGSVSPSLGYSESPTITYTPLQGKEFVGRMMTPVGLETLASLIETGWSGETALRLLVQRINNIPNGFDGSTVNAEMLPDYHKFNRVARLFDRLMSRGIIFLTMVPENHYPVTSMDWEKPDNNLRSNEIRKDIWEPADNPVMLNIRRDFSKKGGSEHELRELLYLLGVPQNGMKARNKFNTSLDSLILQTCLSG